MANRGYGIPPKSPYTINVPGRMPISHSTQRTEAAGSPPDALPHHGTGRQVHFGSPGYASPEALQYRQDQRGAAVTPANPAVQSKFDKRHAGGRAGAAGDRIGEIYRDEVPGSLAPSYHGGGRATHHVETVGFPGNGEAYRHASHPNSEARRGTDGFFPGDGKPLQPQGQTWSANAGAHGKRSVVPADSTPKGTQRQFSRSGLDKADDAIQSISNTLNSGGTPSRRAEKGKR